MPVSIHDVAAYILKKHGEMSAMKLQKLVYYSQAWSLVWDEKRLFKSRVEAWANGPVFPTLYSLHRGQFLVKAWPQGDQKVLKGDAKDTVDTVLEYYGAKTAHALSDLTHREKPWKDARKGLADMDASKVEITEAAMAEYYGSL